MKSLLLDPGGRARSSSDSRLAALDDGGDDELLDAAAGRPGADQLAALRLWRHPDIDKAGFGQPGLGFLDRRGAGNATAQQGRVILQLRGQRRLVDDIRDCETPTRLQRAE